MSIISLSVTYIILRIRVCQAIFYHFCGYSSNLYFDSLFCLEYLENIRTTKYLDYLLNNKVSIFVLNSTLSVWKTKLNIYKESSISCVSVLKYYIWYPSSSVILYIICCNSIWRIMPTPTLERCNIYIYTYTQHTLPCTPHHSSTWMSAKMIRLTIPYLQHGAPPTPTKVRYRAS